MGTFTQQTSSNPDQRFLLLSGQERRIKVEFTNSNNVYYDPYSLILTIYRPDNVVFFNESYTITSSIKKEDTGKYYIDFIGDTNYTGDYQFIWAWRDEVGGEAYNGFQAVTLAPIQVYGAFPYLRNQLDKAQKDLDKIYGYNDSQLYMFLRGGLDEINRIPPSTSLTLVTYPWKFHLQLIVDVATFVGVVSQTLLAADTDANYSLQGNSMSVDHFTKYSAFLNMLNQRMNQSVNHFKMGQYTRIGAVKAERGPGFRQQSIFAAASPGVSFGNILGVRI